MVEPLYRRARGNGGLDLRRDGPHLSGERSNVLELQGR